MTQKNKIVFIGTPQIAADLLELLLEGGLEIDSVITKPDKKTGRAQKLTPSRVKEVALRHGLTVYTPERIREFEEIYEEPVDLILTCAYGQILPKRLLDHPKHGCLNLHGSLLPAHRGGAPVQRAIWNAEPVSGVSLMKMDEGLDTGPVMVQKAFPIEGMNTEQVFKRMSEEGAALILENIEAILDGRAQFIPQDDSLSSYSPVLTKAEEKLDLDQPDARVLGQILAFAPEPGCWISIDGKKIKIFEADYRPGPSEPGLFQIENKKEASLGLSQGKLYLKKVQPAGKKAMEIASFIQGQGRALDGKKVD